MLSQQAEQDVFSCYEGNHGRKFVEKQADFYY